MKKEKVNLILISAVLLLVVGFIYYYQNKALTGAASGQYVGAERISFSCPNNALGFKPAIIIKPKAFESRTSMYNLDDMIFDHLEKYSCVLVHYEGQSNATFEIQYRLEQPLDPELSLVGEIQDYITDVSIFDVEMLPEGIYFVGSETAPDENEEDSTSATTSGGGSGTGGSGWGSSTGPNNPDFGSWF